MEYDLTHPGDFHLCHEAMEGDRAAIEKLHEITSQDAVGYLVHRGASHGEALDVVRSLWTDLLVSRPPRAPRIATYSGRCAFQSWFNKLALNDLISTKRREARQHRITPHAIDGNPDRDQALQAAGSESAAANEPEKEVLGQMMREAVEYAFKSCEPEDFVLLMLRHCDGIQGTELATMFNCDSTRISHRLRAAQEQISRRTLWRIRQQDQWLDLRWEDFMELCRTATPTCFGLD